MNHLSNFVSQFNMAIKQRRLQCMVFNTLLIRNILAILIKLGYIITYNTVKKNRYLKLNFFLRFDEFNRPTLRSIVSLSKPGKRVYLSTTALRGLNRQKNAAFGNSSTIILSTNKGVLSAQEAYRRGVGGEALLILQ